MDGDVVFQTLLLLQLRMKDILEHVDSKNGLVGFHVIGEPHTLPLGLGKLAWLLLLAVNGWHDEQLAILGTEDISFFDAVEICLWGVLAEEVELQLWVVRSHGVILLGKFSTELVDGFLRTILDGREESVQVIALWVEVESCLTFGLDVDSPTVVVILHHLHVVNGDLSLLTDGFGKFCGLLLVADRGILYLLATLCFGNDIEGRIDIEGYIVKIAGVLLHSLCPLWDECLAFWSESGCHAHLLHLDG